MEKIFTCADAEKQSGEHVIMPDGYTAIGDEAFNQRWCLESLTMSESITHVGVDAFESCYNLKNIVVPESSKYYEKVKVFEDLEEIIIRAGSEVFNIDFKRFRRKSHMYIFGTSDAEIMREMLAFEFAPLLGEFEYLSDSIELTSDLYQEMKELYTAAYENGLESLMNISNASHPVIRLAMKIIISGNTKYLRGGERLPSGGYAWVSIDNILHGRARCEDGVRKKRVRASLGYRYIKEVFMNMGYIDHFGFPPELFDYILRDYRRELPDYTKSRYELRIEKMVELAEIARIEGIKELKRHRKSVEFLKYALSLYFKREYVKDKFNYFWEGNIQKDYSPKQKVRAEIIKDLNAMLEAEKSKAVTKEDAIILSLTMDGIIHIIEGSNPKVMRNHLEFAYGVFWDDGMTWKNSNNSLFARIDELCDLCKTAVKEGLLAFAKITARHSDIFLRFALDQLVDGLHWEAWHPILIKRINNELLSGKTPDELRMLELTAEGFYLMMTMWTQHDELHKKLSEMVDSFDCNRT